MCGIVGVIGAQNAQDVVLDGLARLEYRGYDSAGLACIAEDGLCLVRTPGRVQELREKCVDLPPTTTAIGHTRWATHGAPCEANAHPHTDAHMRFAIVHNGIIENHDKLRADLEAEGVRFHSETDSEVIAHLIAQYDQGNLLQAVEHILPMLDGTLALAVLSIAQPDSIVVARRGSPLAIGLADGMTLLASDAVPILPHTNRVVFLDDNQVAELSPGIIHVREDAHDVDAKITEIHWSAEEAEKGGYPHFMLKEIAEQPVVLEKLVRARVTLPPAIQDTPTFAMNDAELPDEMVQGISRIILLAQGTSFHAAMIGRNMIERVVRIPSYPEYAADFRYRDPILDPSVLVIAISQSGETADTLAAIHLAQERGCKVLAIVNAVGSTMARDADYVFYMNCGPEIGVASTKAFTAMIASLYILALRMSQQRATLDVSEQRRRAANLIGIGPRIEATLSTRNYIRQIAIKYKGASNFLFLGRGTGWPLAMEGALKLKEVSYIHAEGYDAAEMKHGPIALIDENMPVLVIALRGRRYEKILGNIQEVKARGGKVIVIASHDDDEIHHLADDVIYVRAESGVMNSIACALPLQLLAYYIAEARGCDVDKPKNLAKSVTVE